MSPSIGWQVLDSPRPPHRRDVVTALAPTRVRILGVQSTGKPENCISSIRLLSTQSSSRGQDWYVIARTAAISRAWWLGRNPPISVGPNLDRRGVRSDGKIGLVSTSEPCRNSGDFGWLLNLFPIPLLDGGHLFYYAWRYSSASHERQGATVRLQIGLMAGHKLDDLRHYNDVLR